MQQTSYEVRSGDCSSDVCFADRGVVEDVKGQLRIAAGTIGQQSFKLIVGQLAEKTLGALKNALEPAPQFIDGQHSCIQIRNADQPGHIRQPLPVGPLVAQRNDRSEEHTSELQSLMSLPYTVS